jgi:hypothetical protein
MFAPTPPLQNGVSRAVRILLGTLRDDYSLGVDNRQILVTLPTEEEAEREGLCVASVNYCYKQLKLISFCSIQLFNLCLELILWILKNTIQLKLTINTAQ